MDLIEVLHTVKKSSIKALQLIKKKLSCDDLKLNSNKKLNWPEK